MAQKIVFQALREATVTETDVRHFRTLAKLRKSTQADCPAAFFEEFLELHRQEKPGSRRRNTAPNQQ
ncbi:hypothetical protein Bca4012_032030 [Brassica carinata]